MVDITIGFFTTQELAGACEFARNDPHYAARVAKTYLETGIDDYSSFSSDCKLETVKHPNPPKEAPGASVVDDICNDGNEKSYNTVWNWFVDWWKYKDCKDDHLDVDDVYFLLTNHDGGGRGMGRTAALGGQDLIDMDNSYQYFGYGNDFKTASNVFEEAGHCLINNMSDEDGDGAGHDSGILETDDSTGERCISPLGLSENETECFNVYRHENNCGGCYDKDSWNDGYVFRYSDCSLEHFQT